MAEFGPSVFCTESPLDGDPILVAGHRPGFRLEREHLPIWDATPQALSFKGADLALGWVQPAAMLGRVVKLQALADAQRLRRLIGSVQTRWSMGVEVVHH